ncbi:hypothetical protein [Caulobacter sp. RL271]|uniref:Uncharacterized protein n=1 Tax=Caulobacter segnis TaxID=88688 RepID=A0ABY4ZUA0_9CAUL|nr:hypothetical protein [Caulobacter segnis]USQ96316.1 hypothetical protein MZV50_01590 [Caulobacter segnis]
MAGTSMDEGPVLDQQSLRQAMVEAAASAAAPSLTGRRFRLTTRFVEEKPRKYGIFKQSGRWLYDKRTGSLVTSIGFGEITERNFGSFKNSGLQVLPPLQSFFFDVETHRGQPLDAEGRPIGLMAPSAAIGMTPGRAPPPSISYQLADSTKAISFGLAIPYEENGPSALPAGMAPLEVSQARGRRDHAERFARDLTLVVEGEITDLGQKPQVFCGGYRGALTFKEITGYTPNWIKDQQCFVTARIDRVQVMRGETVVSAWPKAAKAAD